MFNRIDYPKNNIGPIYFEFNSKDGLLHENLKMFGSIRYQDLSVYTGPLIYKNNKGNKIGFGEQDFSQSDIFNSSEAGITTEYKMFKYIGNFDYKKTDWIYGNGVLYFVNKNNEPCGFVKAFWWGLRPIRPYKGTFDYTKLLKGFTKDMELQPGLIHFERFNQVRDLAINKKIVDMILIGDSWFEFYQKGPNEETTGDFNLDCLGKDILNLGVGGSIYQDWIKYLPEILPYLSFKRVIINLGYNDSHAGLSAKEIFSDFKKVIKLIRSYNPEAEIYVNAVSPCKGMLFTQKKKNLINELIISYTKKYKKIFYLPVNKYFIQDNKVIDNLQDYFYEDNIHLNKVGSRLWSEEMRRLF